MYLSIHSIYDVNLQQTSKKSYKIDFQQKPFHWQQPSVTLGDLPCCAKMACCPWWPWRSRAANRESQGAGPRRQSGTLSPKAGRLGFKTTKAGQEEFFFIVLGGVFFYEMFLDVPWCFPLGKNSGVLGKNSVFAVFHRKTWNICFNGFLCHMMNSQKYRVTG